MRSTPNAIIRTLPGLVVAVSLGTAMAQPSWWGLASEPPLVVNVFPLPGGAVLPPGQQIPPGQPIGDPERLDIEIEVPGPAGASVKRTLHGYEALVFLSVRDYVVFDTAARTYRTTNKLAQKSILLDIVPGSYHYLGNGSAVVTRTGTTINVRLTWQHPPNQPDLYEVQAQWVAPGRALGKFRCLRRTPPMYMGWMEVDIVRVQEPGTVRLQFLAPKGDGGAGLHGLVIDRN